MKETKIKKSRNMSWAEWNKRPEAVKLLRKPILTKKEKQYGLSLQKKAREYLKSLD